MGSHCKAGYKVASSDVVIASILHGPALLVVVVHSSYLVYSRTSEYMDRTLKLPNT